MLKDGTMKTTSMERAYDIQAHNIQTIHIQAHSAEAMHIERLD